MVCQRNLFKNQSISVNEKHPLFMHNDMNFYFIAFLYIIIYIKNKTSILSGKFSTILSYDLKETDFSCILPAYANARQCRKLVVIHKTNVFLTNSCVLLAGNTLAYICIHLPLIIKFFKQLCLFDKAFDSKLLLKFQLQKPI